MSRRAGNVRRSNGVVPLPSSTETRALSNEVGELDASSEISLPRDHPRWRRDGFTVSAATKALLERLAPLAIRVFGFWDHRVHRLALDDSTIEIDASGSYRLEKSAAAP